MITDWYFYLAAIPAVIVMGLSKGGFSGLSLISTPLLTLVMSPVKAAAIMLPILLVQDAVSVWAYRHTFDRRVLLYMLPGSCLGIFIGWLVAKDVSDAVVGIVVGIIAVVFVAMAMVRALRGRPVVMPGQREPVLAPALFWGACSGFTSFISHAGAPTFQVYVLPLGLSPQYYAGTTTMFFAATNLIKVAPYLALGQFSRENLSTSAVLFPLAAVATLCGVWLVRRVPAEGFFRLIYGLTLVVGLLLIYEGARAITGH